MVHNIQHDAKLMKCYDLNDIHVLQCSNNTRAYHKTVTGILDHSSIDKSKISKAHKYYL